jgi:hypothetical protein
MNSVHTFHERLRDEIAAVEREIESHNQQVESLTKRLEGLKRADELFESDQAAMAELLQTSIANEWRHCGIERASDIYERFVPHFFFGCEGDDRVTSWAFDSKRNPLGARLNAIYGSDLGHYDLIDMRDAGVEAYEGVEQGLMTEEDFRDFVFTNPIKLHCGMNPDFFKGTVVEDSAARVVAELIGPV